MRNEVHLTMEPGEVAREIASILAQGHLRCRESRSLDTSAGKDRPHVAQVEESEAFTSIRLDSSGHRSLHSQAGYRFETPPENEQAAGMNSHYEPFAQQFE